MRNSEESIARNPSIHPLHPPSLPIPPPPPLAPPPPEGLGSAYPELSRKELFIREVVDSSESHFFAQKILARSVFEAALTSLPQKDGVISVRKNARLSDCI